MKGSDLWDVRPRTNVLFYSYVACVNIDLFCSAIAVEIMDMPFVRRSLQHVLSY
jgi:hypothetical protein